MGKEEARAGRHLVEEEELLLLSDLAMVALGSFLEHLLVLLHLLLVGKRDTVDALQGVVLGVTKEVGRRVLSQ